MMTDDEPYQVTGDYRQLLVHPVFKAAAEIAMERVDGRCACGAEATQVAVIKFPPRGMFLVPSNLRAVCVACFPTSGDA
jgi:hypothetical protein